MVLMELVSEYVCSLSATSRKRYLEKLECACLKWDPYAIKEWIKEPEKLPNVSWTDLTCYMVATPSPYTQETIKV